jgi:hypothetical protein
MSVPDLIIGVVRVATCSIDMRESVLRLKTSNFLQLVYTVRNDDIRSHHECVTTVTQRVAPGAIRSASCNRLPTDHPDIIERFGVQPGCVALAPECTLDDESRQVLAGCMGIGNAFVEGRKRSLEGIRSNAQVVRIEGLNVSRQERIESSHA